MTTTTTQTAKTPNKTPTIPRKLRFILCLIGWCCASLISTYSYADTPPPYVIHTQPANAKLTIYSELLHDLDGDIDIHTITQPEYDPKFTASVRHIERLGIRDGQWWARVAIQNRMAEQQDFALVIHGNPNAQLYLPNAQYGGYQLAPASQRLPGRDAAYRIRLESGENQLFFIRIPPRGYLTFGLSLTTINNHIGHHYTASALYMLLCGSLLMLALYHCIAFVMRAGKQHLFQALFIVSAITVILVMADFVPRRLTAGTTLYGHILSAAIMLPVLSVTALTLSFFPNELSRRARIIGQGIMIVAAVNLALAFFLPLSIGIALSFTLASITALFLCYVGYSAWHRELDGGGLFFVSCVLISLPALMTSLSYAGLLQSSLEIPQWLLFFCMLQSLTLGIGLRLERQRTLRLYIERSREKLIAETTESARKNTLSRIGHDIRTPLSGILGMADILAGTPLTPNQKECTTAIQHSGNNLLRIINDILEHSELSSPGADVNWASLDLNHIILDVIDLFREKAEEKGIEIVTHVHTNLPHRVMGDANRLRQVLTNLLGALVRYGIEGELFLDVALDPTGKAGHVRFSFSGSTLREDVVLQLEELRKNKDNNYLSISVAEQLINSLQGRLGSLRDKRGAQYWFVLPLPADKTVEPISEVDTKLLNGKSVLVVDDSRTVTRVLRHQALSWGMRVTTCHDPKEALASLRTQANLREPYDAVILDQNMPGMNGMQLAARIHEDAILNTPMAIIMLTGTQHPPTATQARNVGIHRILTKPVSAPKLRQVLAEELDSKPKIDSPPEEQQQPDPSLRILVAEDHYLSQKVIRGMLSKLGLQCDIASNGKEALAMAEHTRYDLVLMDCEMPEMDGFETTRRIREREKENGLPPIPVIALTAHILKEHKERSFAAGMNAHLPKPVELEVLRETLVQFTTPDAIGKEGAFDDE